MKRSALVLISLFLVLTLSALAEAMTAEQLLGKMLYFDENLSNPAGQSCASCHTPKAGFADPDKTLPVSEGAVPGRFGTRNAPSAAYAAFSPSFYFDGQMWIGGQFWDGRAATLADQAKGPFLNPVEMNNTKDGVIAAVRTSHYSLLFKRVYGIHSLQNVETAYDNVARAIAAFEGTKQVNRFSSRYDYYLKGKVMLTQQELNGLALFNDPAKGNCSACHPSTSVGTTPPLFTDFSYDNLGVPKNAEIEELVGTAVPIDYGLGAIVGDTAENGKFKVATLRNIARTGPYGHNGYFKTLKDIVHFYNTRDVEAWPAPEVPETVNKTELGNLGLTSGEEDAIVAFLMTLSDGYFCMYCR
ncbi:MAG TPA: cytochrome c peroxidase [Dissulfurispiraceae bacterium]|nr:cytochrome c peroxidase [Thermodesulfovibrionales bacterium]HMK57076.1 cytochrome c peroxidase [Dissulfurispiraceae bacterium]